MSAHTRKPFVSRRAIWLVVLSCLLAPTQALACSLPRPMAQVSCTMSDTFLGMPVGTEAIRGYLIRDKPDSMRFLAQSQSGGGPADASLVLTRSTITITMQRHDNLPLVIATILSHCLEDTSAARPAFIKEIEQYHDVWLEPYSERREAELRADRERYLSCFYRLYERVGDWLISTEVGRDYCYSAGGMCPVTQLSWTGLFFYLSGNLNGTTIPYLAGALIVLAALVGLSVYLYRQGEVRAFLRPGLLNSAAVILMTPMLLLLSLPGLKWLLVAYLAGSLLSYPWRRWKRARGG